MENINHENKTMTIMFLDDDRAQTLLQFGHWVNISANCSTFVQRSLMRSICHVVDRQMDNLIHPELYVPVCDQIVCVAKQYVWKVQ